MMDLLKKRLLKLKALLQNNRVGPAMDRGQGLVEMAIITPILIFMLIGLFEVGWALRSYLVLVNTNREITRFAIRPGYLDFSPGNEDPDAIGYDDVFAHVFTVLGADSGAPIGTTGELPLNFDTNSTLIVSHLIADTGKPCVDITDCDCSWFDDLDYRENPDTGPHAGKILLVDDLITHPAMSNQEFQSAKYPPDNTVTTRLVYTDVANELARQNDKFNCELLKKGSGATPSANNVIVTELFFEQPQLLGFPLISNAFTDPVPMYTHTTMRLSAGARSSNKADILGPVCDAYPFIVHKDTIDFDNPTNKIGDKVDIFDGNGGSDFGWLAWNPDKAKGGQSEPHLEDELTYSRTPLNDYTNARDSTDHNLSVDDWVASMQGVKAAVESSEGLLTSLVGTTMRIPVWDVFDTSESPEAYHIIGFAWVRIDSVSDFDDPGPPPRNWESTKEIMATYLGDATDECK